jgi:hypothetical protein
VKLSFEKADCACKLLTEELDSAKKTIEDVTVKKQ